ncbi:MAG: sugar transferase [Roseivirga sp.]|nr:sugar transferase [Roseivirga sp.]
MYKSLVKPIMDFLIALVILLVASPVILVTLISLSILNNGKPFFFQQRPGKNERIFRIIKFKTMNDKVDASGNLLPDSERLTGFGKVVRKLSIDELPQMINVLKGDMSLVGPRPLLVEYLEYYDDVQKRRHNVKPGITGWAQVNGRNTLDWQSKFRFDVWYVDNISFYQDLKILFLTFWKTIKRDGISAEGQATMTKFTGN